MAESIERVERALAAATHGKWAWDALSLESDTPDSDPHVITGHQCEACRKRDHFCLAGNPDNRRLIAAAHNLLPRFIDVVRAAQATARLHGTYLTADHDLVDALAALDTAIQEELPKEESHDQ